MAYFDFSAPPTTYWTPPKKATGSQATMLALNGYKADGQRNTFGQIMSFLPFSDITAKATERNARSMGLTEVGDNINASLAEVSAHSQVGMGALTGLAGALTGQPELIANGARSALGGITGSIAAKPKYNFDGTIAEEPQRFKGGGSVDADPPRKAINKGTDFVKDWYTMKALTGQSGLGEKDIELADRVQYPTYANKEEFNAARGPGSYGRVAGTYQGKPQPDGTVKGKTYISDIETDPTALMGISAHESNHQMQHEGLGSSSGHPHPAWTSTVNAIKQEVQSAGKSKMGYYGDPTEIHSRLMQIRQDAGFKPGEVVTPASYWKYKNAPKGNILQEQPVMDLLQIMDHSNIINLLNKTVMNDTTAADPAVQFAALGGAVDGAGAFKRYEDHDTTEDIVGYDKRTGKRVLEMRYGELIFDQDARETIDSLIQTGDSAALGDYVAAERQTHANAPEAVQTFRGGGGIASPAVLARQKILRASGHYTGRLDGISGPKTRAAESAYAKARKGAAPVGTSAAAFLPNPAAAAAEAAAYGTYQNNINTPAADLSLNARSASDPTQALGNVGLSSAADGSVAMNTDGTPKTGTAYVAPKAVAGSSEGMSSFLGNALDAGRAVSAAIGASQELPAYKEDPAITAERERLHRQSMQGMDAGELTRLENQTRQQSAIQAEQLRGQIGGGASQAAVVATALSGRQNDTAAALAVTDANHNRQLQGQTLYDAALNAKQGLDYSQYQTNYNNTLQSRNAFGSAMAANLQHIADRQAYDRTQPAQKAYLEALMRSGGAGSLGGQLMGLNGLSALGGTSALEYVKSHPVLNKFVK